jgi:hypothetical protein
MLLQIALAFVVVVFKVAHEYKLSLFYSYGKRGGSSVAANAQPITHIFVMTDQATHKLLILRSDTRMEKRFLSF